MQSRITQRIAVKALILDTQGRALLLRKGNDDHRHAGNSGRYNLPGGKIDPGEILIDALRREVREETGLIVGAVGQPFFSGEWRPIVRGEAHQIIGLFFVCKNWSGEVQLDAESDDYCWVSPLDAASYRVLEPEDQALAYYARQKN